MALGGTESSGGPDLSAFSTWTLPLPPTFLSIEAIRELPNDDIKKGKMVNVIGFIKDFQKPIETRGTGLSNDH